MSIYIDNKEERDFISEQIEKTISYSPANKKNFYYALLRSEVLDHFMQIKFGTRVRLKDMVVKEKKVCY